MQKIPFLVSLAPAPTCQPNSTRHEKSWNPSTDRFLGAWNFPKIVWFATTQRLFHSFGLFWGNLLQRSVVNIHKWFVLHLWKFYWMIFSQICWITPANNLKMHKKHGNIDKKFLNPKRFPQTAPVRLDLFSCLNSTWFDFQLGQGLLLYLVICLSVCEGTRIWQLFKT